MIRKVVEISTLLLAMGVFVGSCFLLDKNSVLKDEMQPKLRPVKLYTLSKKVSNMQLAICKRPGAAVQLYRDKN